MFCSYNRTTHLRSEEKLNHGVFDEENLIKLSILFVDAAPSKQSQNDLNPQKLDPRNCFSREVKGGVLLV